MKGSSLRSTALALTLAALVPGALEGQEGGGGDPPPGSYCQGCAERHYRQQEEPASCDVIENTQPGGAQLRCTVEAKIVTEAGGNDCSGQTSECSNATCKRKWKVLLRSTPTTEGGCDGTVVQLDERVGNQPWSELTSEQWDAGTLVGEDFVQVYPDPNDPNADEWSDVHVGCGRGTARKEVRLELTPPSGSGAGEWSVDCSDEDRTVWFQFRCDSCVHPTQL